MATRKGDQIQRQSLAPQKPFNYSRESHGAKLLKYTEKKKF